ncbi:hypothetical protein BT69DRAFT_1277934 [Atractiella rhizophila]|nr:hypothetical protein BT69DRAFT_1277934 [Atractiella rhizophila]
MRTYSRKTAVAAPEKGQALRHRAAPRPTLYLMGRKACTEWMMNLSDRRRTHEVGKAENPSLVDWHDEGDLENPQN